MSATEAVPPVTSAGDQGGPGVPEGGAIQTRGSGRLLLSAFARNWQARMGIGIIIAIAAFCFVGPLFYRTNQVTVNLNLKDLVPGGSHPLGTDDTGYDVLGRLMLAGQSSLELGIAVAIVSTVIGTVYGAVAGLVGGIIDALMMRVIDTLLAIPTLVLLLILVNMFTPNLLLLIVMITVLTWLDVARLVRGEVLSLRTRDFVMAARMMGSTKNRLMWRHLLPNSIGVITVNATFSVADAILYLSVLSFLGLGLPPPHTNWGAMMSNGLNDLFDGYWWLVYPPAILLIFTLMGFSLIGDAVRDSLDVRLQRR
jgi:peptide/nickel transport system permease protein